MFPRLYKSLVKETSADELWVKYDSSPVPVPTINCKMVAHFIKAIKAELTPKLDHVSVTDISIHLSENSDPVKRGTLMRNLSANKEENPIIVKVLDANCKL